MKKTGRKFLLDANVPITAHRSYYAFDLCPGFWQSVLDGFAAGRIYSTQRVDAELMNAIVEALDAHTSMSSQALNSEKVRKGLKNILLNHSHLWELLRDKGAA